MDTHVICKWGGHVCVQVFTRGDLTMCERLYVCVQVCVCAHVCACSQGDREIYHLNLASPGDESKAKFRFKSHQHEQEGSLALRDYLRCAAERAGRQEAASSPSAGSHLLSAGPWDLLWLLQERETWECSSDNHMPVPGAGGGVGAGWHRLGLPGAMEKQREKRQEPTGQKEAQALPGLDAERGARQEAALAPGQTPPGHPLRWPGKHPPGSRSEPRAPRVLLALFSL